MRPLLPLPHNRAGPGEDIITPIRGKREAHLKNFRREPSLLLRVRIPTLHGGERRWIERLCTDRHHAREGSAPPLRIGPIDMRARRP